MHCFHSLSFTLVWVQHGSSITTYNNNNYYIYYYYYYSLKAFSCWLLCAWMILHHAYTNMGQIKNDNVLLQGGRFALSCLILICHQWSITGGYACQNHQFPRQSELLWLISYSSSSLFPGWQDGPISYAHKIQKGYK